MQHVSVETKVGLIISWGGWLLTLSIPTIIPAVLSGIASLLVIYKTWIEIKKLKKK